MITFVPKVVAASFARMTVEHRKEVAQMLSSVVERLSISNVADEPQEEKASRQKLKELGLMTEVKSLSSQPEGERNLVEVKGKPLSQTIIEERR